MHLSNIRLTDYGPFRSAVWTLPSVGLVLVAGANNAGKSTLVRALDVVASPEPQEVRVYAHAKGNAELTASFRLDQSDVHHLLGLSTRVGPSVLV